MTALERVLIPAAALLFALAVAAGVFQVLTAGPFTINGHPPIGVLIARFGMHAAPILVMTAFASLAGLLFLRAVRWRPQPSQPPITHRELS